MLSVARTIRNATRDGTALQIVFAPAGTDADSEIERLIAAHDAPRQLLVVSSDHRLHRAAQKRKCQAIDSEPFWESLAEQPDEADRASQTPANPGTAYWLQEFTDVDQELFDNRTDADAVFDADYLEDLEDLESGFDD